VASIAVLFLVGCTAGKMLSSNVAMRLAGVTQCVRDNLGPALIPQAGVANGHASSISCRKRTSRPTSRPRPWKKPSISWSHC
jgi:hypothetical protein